MIAVDTSSLRRFLAGAAGADVEAVSRSLDERLMAGFGGVADDRRIGRRVEVMDELGDEDEVPRLVAEVVGKRVAGAVNDPAAISVDSTQVFAIDTADVLEIVRAIRSDVR